MSSITVSLDKLGKALENEVKKDIKQVKFAAMKATNEVAFKARKALQEEYTKSFHVRNKNLPKAIQVKKATKENIVAEVSFPKDWMKLNTTGGEKKSESGKNLAFAGSEMEKGRMSSGKIKQSQKPGALLKYADSHKKRSKGSTSRKPHAFKTIGKHGYEVIGIRDGSRKVNWLYSLQKKAKIEKKWDFDGIVKKVADRELGKEFDKQLKHAIATAK